jgi:ABC-2 type transport system permease protein
MTALASLTIANIKSFVRDRAALFWTFAFPITFVVLFGSIFSGGAPTYDVGWVDQDATEASQALRQGIGTVPIFKLTDVSSEEDGLARMRDGKLDTLIIAPKGLGAAVTAAAAAPTAAGPAIDLKVYVDPSQSTNSQTIRSVVSQVVGELNQRLSGRPPVVGLSVQTLQTQQISNAAYFVPSILAMALMQLGVFSAIPLVSQREKLILKRLSATPLRRWMLVGSNLVMRLGIASVQAVLIIGIGAALFGVTVVGSLVLLASLIALGALTFISLGYVLASYAKTEDSANALTSVVQFPLMFLSGIFFPIQIMPAFLRPIATVMPLTYLGDALRQVMVGGAPFAPLAVDVLVLGGWLLVSFLISARFFRWQ